MPTLLNEKEKEYIDLNLISGNVGNPTGTGVKPSYKIADWLRAKNINEKWPEEIKDIDSNHNNFLNLTREIEFSSTTMSLDTYIALILARKEVKVKGRPISYAFG